MNLHVTNKFKLIDLATLGTNARKHIQPDLIVSDYKKGIFKEGDILDANAVYTLLKTMRSTGSNIGDNEEIVEYINQLKRDIEELKHGPKIVIITQDQYDALENYKKDTIYVITESTSQWTFGDKLPITFSEN